MLFGLFWGDWTVLILLPGVLLTLWAQYRVKSTCSAYVRMAVRPGMTGAAVARRILDSNGLSDVQIEPIAGEMTDHYDPRDKVLRLSDTSFGYNSVAAVGIAAHEAGHAMQHGRNYFPLKFRIAIVPVCNIGSRLAMPLFLIGLLVSVPAVSDYLMLAGIAAFSLSVFFQLITLPVEFNASARAMRCLTASHTMTEEQLKGARKVLTAAALTYVAALAVGLLSLLRLLLLFGRSSRRR